MLMFVLSIIINRFVVLVDAFSVLVLGRSDGGEFHAAAVGRGSREER